jgi:hypothetical protein
VNCWSAPAKLWRIDLGSRQVDSTTLSGGVVELQPFGTAGALVVLDRGASVALETFATTKSLSVHETDAFELYLGGRSFTGVLSRTGTDRTVTLGLSLLDEEREAPAIFFWDVLPLDRLVRKGPVAASAGLTESDPALATYANARPLFVGDRTFALLGPELFEVSIEDVAERVGPSVSLSSSP